MPDPSKFDWNDLAYFLAVARAGRLTLAAHRLGVEHSTVSRRIAALEAALGTRLFTRMPAGYALTPAGEQLLKLAEDMESVASTVAREVGEGDLALAGTVRIGAPDGFGTYFLAACLGRLALRHPSMQLELIATPRVFNLSKREADIAIALSRPHEGRVHARKLTDYELGVYASDTYLRGAAAITCREDLAHHPFIGYADDYIFTPELDYVPILLRELRPVLRSSSIVAQLHATVSGAGLCVLPVFMARELPNLRRVLPAELQLKRAFWMLTHAELQGLARVRTTVDFILREVTAARALFVDPASSEGSGQGT